MRIGLLGGSFNPVHNAHLAIARAAAAACALDRVIFIPAADPPHKIVAGGVPFEQRAAMVLLAIDGAPRFSMSAIEAERSGKSYSIDTIRQFRGMFPADRLYFIIGADSYLELGTWHRYREFLSECSLIVAERPGSRIADPVAALPDGVRGCFTQDTRSRRLTHHAGTEIVFITGVPQELSSTEIRRLAAAGADIASLVPPDVAAYITQQRMYS